MMKKNKRISICALLLLSAMMSFSACAPRDESKSLKTVSNQIIGDDTELVSDKTSDESTTITTPSVTNAPVTSDELAEILENNETASNNTTQVSTNSEATVSEKSPSSENTAFEAVNESPSPSAATDSSADSESDSVPLPNKTADISSFQLTVFITCALVVLTVAIVAVRKVGHRRKTSIF